MPRVRDLLYRFRPAGAPGPATAVGVPADRTAETALELAPLFVLLAETEADCARIQDRADHDAVELTQVSRERAAAIVAAAAERADAEQATARTEAERVAEVGSADALGAAQREAMGLGARAAARMPAQVELAVKFVMRLLENEAPAVPRRSGVA